MAKQHKAHGAGYRVFHSILCVIATLILLGCITTAAVMRYYLKSDSLTNSVASLELGGTKVPFTKQTVAEMIRSEYGTDDQVTPEDMETAIDQLQIPQYVAGKLTTYFDMLRGNTDTVIQIPAEEIVAILENNQDALHDKCMILIEESDKAAIRQAGEAGGALDTVNRIFDTVYGSPALRMLARFRVSIYRIILDLVLLALLLWRWTTVFARSEKKRTGAVKGMGITLLVPSILTVAACLVSVVMGFFAKDGVKDLSAVIKEARTPVLLYGSITLFAGIILLCIAKLANLFSASRKEKKEKKLAAAQEQADAEEKAQNAHCIYCKRTIKAGAKFCTYCGKTQDESDSEDDVSSAL